MDRFAGIEKKFDKATENLQAEMDALTARVTRREAHEDVVVAEANAAAGTAAAMMASAHLTDLTRRIGYLEATSGQTFGDSSGRFRLPST